MRYLSFCSGIEAASCAWKSLGWKAVAYSEIEAFPCSVLKHHFPDTPNWGDMTKWRDWPRETIDLLVGGTPCQSFSTAGLRKGLDDVRGQLALGFSQIAKHSRPRWIVWENVPGVLSSGGGRDFGSFIGSLVELGYGLCWRVLDAQFFGVPQRRRRVFVVGYLGDWRNSAAVLFEQESLRGDSKAGRKKRKGTAKGSADSVEVECRSCGVMWEPDGPIECCPVCGSHQSYIPEKCGTLTDGAHMGGGLNGQDVYTGRVISISGNVRRLTPLECERLQGFPDGWTDVPNRGKPAPDGPRYKAIGNSMAVPVMRWIGNRIQMVEELMNDRK
jgi:DNA (cytosine-5)-methyltransferase 1